MSFAEFQASITRDAAPPAGMRLALQALWHDARNNWERAHACAQEDESRNGAWAHAYLHRKEGDAGNARYWYTRAARKTPLPTFPLSDEWASIAHELLSEAQA